MEGRSMACHALGTINSLVDKITQITKSHPEIEVLQQPLEILRNDYMNKLARRDGATGGEQVKVWMKQVREMVYDIEDWIDTKQDAANFAELDEPQINKFKDQIEEAQDRCRRYELLNQAPASDDGCARSTYVSIVDHPLHWEKKFLVGISDQKSELLNHLENKQEELKVVSILGTGGHGKTTLAKEIYEDIKMQFQCHAFVSVGEATSTRTTIVDILRQVKSEADTPEASGSNVKQVNEVITELWGLLRTKRYFICIDDMRCPWASKVVNCALPDNNLGSRILTTTRIKNIAISCSRNRRDVVYEMKALSKDDSKSLFVNSIYDRPVERANHSNESSEKLLELCGGIPLAIITAAGLLSCKTSAELHVLSRMFNKTTSLEAQSMKKILDICYSDLRLSLKSCFLYLISFSGNHINKGHLIRRWAAEGLITKIHGKSLWKTGESYFNELIIRRLIQPVFDDDDDQPIGCAVDGAISDFIESMSAEENFITLGAELKAGVFPHDRVRRVSIDCSGEGESDTSCAYPLFEKNSWVTSCYDKDERSSLCSDDAEPSNLSTDDNEPSKVSSDDDEASILSNHDEEESNLRRHLSVVRSFAFSGDSRSMPYLMTLKHIRVLDLEDTKGLTYNQLESIGHLFLLRYLGLGGTNITKLAHQIMALKNLITLDLRRTEVRQLPAFGDNKLAYLLTPGLIIPRGMGGVEELEELSKAFLGRNVLFDSHADNVAQLVNQSRRLRKLGVKFGYILETERQGLKNFLEEVKKSNLQSLSLDDYPCSSVDLLIDCWAHKRVYKLTKFELRICDCFPLVPQGIASIKALTHLHIQVKVVEAQGIRALGRLFNLVVLKLFSKGGTQERVRVGSSDGFGSLKLFSFSSYFQGMELQFTDGAMPRLRRLQIEFNARKTKFFHCNYDFGIQHLRCLLQVCAIIHCKQATDPEVKAAETAIRYQVSRVFNKLLSMKDYGSLRMIKGIGKTRKSTTSTVDIRISISLEKSSHLHLPETEVQNLDPANPEHRALVKLHGMITSKDCSIANENLSQHPSLIPGAADGFHHLQLRHFEKYFASNSFDLLAEDTLVLPSQGAGSWKKHSREMGWGIKEFHGRTFIGFKRTFVFCSNNTKTDWIMNIYALIEENRSVNTMKYLCHVFQSSNKYDPQPRLRLPMTMDTAVDPAQVEDNTDSSRPLHPSYMATNDDIVAASSLGGEAPSVDSWHPPAAQLAAAKEEKLRKPNENPTAYKKTSSYVLPGPINYDPNVAGPSAEFASGKKKRKRSSVWSKYTEISASSEKGKVLTLCICNVCGMASKKTSGTSTLARHKCNIH